MMISIVLSGMVLSLLAPEPVQGCGGQRNPGGCGGTAPSASTPSAPAKKPAAAKAQDVQSIQLSSAKLSLQIVRRGNDVSITQIVPAENGRKRVSRGSMTPSEFDSALMKEIQATVWSLPSNRPNDPRDLYEMGAVLRIQSGGKRWENRIPAGPVPENAERSPLPSPAHRQAFQSMIQKIRDRVKPFLSKTDLL